jgi:hypothetical protein
MRKIIQVSSSGVDCNISTQCSHILIALCDDGTVWELPNSGQTRGWNRLPGIPQDEEKYQINVKFDHSTFHLKSEDKNIFETKTLGDF